MSISMLAERTYLLMLWGVVSVTDRLRMLFYIALGNFVFPGGYLHP
jgi:hypothetical protein